MNDWTSCDKPCDNGTRSRMNAAGNESQEIRCNVQMCDAGQYRTIQMTATSGSAYKHRCFCLYKVVCDPHPYFAIGHKVLFDFSGLCDTEINVSGNKTVQAGVKTFSPLCWSGSAIMTAHRNLKLQVAVSVPTCAVPKFELVQRSYLCTVDKQHSLSIPSGHYAGQIQCTEHKYLFCFKCHSPPTSCWSHRVSDNEILRAVRVRLFS